MELYGKTSTFKDRSDAGQRLATELSEYRYQDCVIYAIPRGGIPVAMEVSSELKIPLDIVIVRKIPVPFEPEAGFGAITEDGTMVLNEPMVKRLGLHQNEIESQADSVRAEIIRRSMLYRRKLTPSPVKGKVAIIIDDGLASGYTMIAAIQSLRQRKASQVIVAVPVASGSAYDLVKPRTDNLICLILARIAWFAVASYYHNWYDLTDKDVLDYLEKWRLHSSVHNQ